MTETVVVAESSEAQRKRKGRNSDPRILRYRRPVDLVIPSILSAITDLRSKGVRVVTPPVFRDSAELRKASTTLVGPGRERRVHSKVRFHAVQGDHERRTRSRNGLMIADPLDILTYCGEPERREFLYGRGSEVEAAALVWRIMKAEQTLCFRLTEPDTLHLRFRERVGEASGILMLLEPIS